MSLRDLMRMHSRGALTSSAHHGETVTRVRAGVADLVVPVTIRRRGREFDESGARIPFRRAEVHVPAGYDVADGDLLVFAMQEGETETSNRITELLSRDAGGTLWEVQA